jgi:high-affinity iron transporter
VTLGRRLAVAFAGVIVTALMFVSSAPRASAQVVSRDDAIAQLQSVRASIDHTLALIKAGHADEAFAAARDGYLQHFELVEIPLRAIDNTLTINAESTFAEIRQAIRDHASVESIRTSLVKLRTIIDECERRLTTVGPGAAALVTSQSFIIIFREGFEVVLLVSILLGYLEAARSPQFIKPIMVGIGLAAVATIATVFAMRWLFEVLPVGIEVVEAVTALIAVAVLVYVSFWLVARLEHKRWMEFVRARLWSAVSLGSATSLMLVGFTSVYREGFETALFYQSLWSFGTGLGGYVVLGLGLGLIALTFVSWAIFRLGRRLPVRQFMNVAVGLIMATSVAFLGNAVHSLQTADLVPYHQLRGWPRPPIFLAQATGYWPTWQTVIAQAALTALYLLGAVYAFAVRPHIARRRSAPSRQPTLASSA